MKVYHKKGKRLYFSTYKELVLELNNSMICVSDLNEVRLPVEYPPITTYSRFADILSILGPHKKTLLWLLNNHILLWISSKGYDRPYWADFKYCSEENLCPFIKEEVIPDIIVSGKFGNIIEFIIDSINKQKYLYLNIDRYYIPEYWDTHPPFHSNHEILVFGYNKNRSTLHVADFFKGGNYMYLEIPFSNFIQAYTEYNANNPENYLGGIYLMKFHSVEYQFDILKVKNLVKDFLMSTDTTIYSSWEEFKKDDTVYGMQYFDVLQEYLKFKIDNEDSVYVDFRPFHLITEFNSVMLIRINYLKENGYIEHYDDVYSMFVKNKEEALYLRNSIIKYRFNKNKEVLKNQIFNIRELAQNQKRSLEHFLRLLN